MIIRYITALVLIPVVLFIVHWGLIPVFILVAGAVVLGLLEFYRLMEAKNYLCRNLLGLTAGMLLCLGAYLQVKQGIVISNVIFVILLCGIFIIHVLRKDLDAALPSVAMTLLGVFYIAWMASHVILLRGIGRVGESLTFLVLFTTWMVDTAAYWVGMPLGRHKLNNVVSPNKSWEGSIGGFLAGIAVVFLWWKISGLGFLGQWGMGLQQVLTPVDCLVIGILLGAGGQFGDLAESLIKRSAGVKDSGVIIPGHGGMLDKIDSLLFNVPLLYYYVKIFVL